MDDSSAHPSARARSIALTPRERECLEGLAEGLTNAGIAKRLRVSLPTVAMHLANARTKLGASTREQAIARAIECGLIDPTRREVPQKALVYLSVAERACVPGEACELSEPRRLDVPQTVVNGTVELEVAEVGFKFALPEPDALQAVHVRVVGTEVTVQPFYKGANEKRQRAFSYSSSGEKSCVCWGAVSCAATKEE